MNVRKQGEELGLVAGAFDKESKLTAEGSRFRFQRALLIISAWPFSLLSPVEGGEMSGARAAGASSFGSRRYQAGDGFSQREARRDSGESEGWHQAESEGQARSSEEWQPPHLGAYVVIPPNPTRREQLQKIANKELEDLAKWKDQHKPGPITLLPQKLGGRASEAEVRQKQQLEHIQAKYKQKLKKEEYGRLKREAEEADMLKKKAAQREKAKRLEEKRRQQEQQRQQRLEEDHYLKTVEFLSRLDIGSSKRASCETESSTLESTAWARRSCAHRQMQRQEENRMLQKMKEEQREKAELLALKQRKEERRRREAHLNEQQRVNNAFLDRLQNNSQPDGIYQSGCLGNMHFTTNSWESEYFY